MSGYIIRRQGGTYYKRAKNGFPLWVAKTSEATRFEAYDGAKVIADALEYNGFVRRAYVVGLERETLGPRML